MFHHHQYTHPHCKIVKESIWHKILHTLHVYILHTLHVLATRYSMYMYMHDCIQ